jgi:hypothetical protein
MRVMEQKTLARLGIVLFYIGGAVWVVYAVGKYLLGWDVSVRQFLPYHLVAIIPGVLLKRCSMETSIKNLLTAFRDDQHMVFAFPFNMG